MHYILTRHLAQDIWYFQGLVPASETALPSSTKDTRYFQRLVPSSETALPLSTKDTSHLIQDTRHKQKQETRHKTSKDALQKDKVKLSERVY